MSGKRWSKLTGTQRAMIAVSGAMQVALAAAAWWDLSRRPAYAVHGSKTAWALAITVNYIGPLAYFRFGRRAVEEPVGEFE